MHNLGNSKGRLLGIPLYELSLSVILAADKVDGGMNYSQHARTRIENLNLNVLEEIERLLPNASKTKQRIEGPFSTKSMLRVRVLTLGFGLSYALFKNSMTT
ncbi:hypothetical protein ACJX0J_018954, partial [Zea mays]